MNKLVISFIALCAILAVTFASPLPTEAEVQEMYSQFLAKYEKVYAGNSNEFQKRYQIFKTNVERAYAVGKMDPSANYGITKFSDLTPEEFQALYLTEERSAEQLKAGIKANAAPSVRKFKDIPEDFDWREKGAVAPVKNQGMCGSCWAFSSTANVESVAFLKTGELRRFSEQVHVDCDHTCVEDDPQECNGGCNGGWMHLALQFVKENGLPLESDYQYTARGGSCKYQHGNATAVEISGYQWGPEEGDDIASFLMENGALSVAINAQYLQFYTGGISDPLVCNPKGLNHGVTIVGFGWGKNMLGTRVPYWIVKNSWGSSWGEKGYFKIRRSKNTCGIESYVVTATM